jgi:hypothetical protein
MAYKDPVRTDTTLVELEVENRNTRYLVLPSVNNAEKPNIIQSGKSKIIVYAEDVALVQAMVEPKPELIDQAKQRLEGKWRAYLKDKHMENLPATAPAVVAERDLWTESVEGCFRELTMGDPGGQRDLLPLVSCTVVREGIIPKEATNPIANALLSKQDAVVAMLTARLTEMQDHIAKLEARLQPQQQAPRR